VTALTSREIGYSVGTGTEQGFADDLGIHALLQSGVGGDEPACLFGQCSAWSWRRLVWTVACKLDATEILRDLPCRTRECGPVRRPR
jgi:hypothetical protein